MLKEILNETGFKNAILTELLTFRVFTAVTLKHDTLLLSLGMRRRVVWYRFLKRFVKTNHFVRKT